MRIGAALRAAYQREQTGGDAAPTGRQVRPHVRRAHWHSYWLGPREGERALLYWKKAKTEQAAIEKARDTYAGASAAFKDQYSLADAIAVRADELDRHETATVE